MEKSKSAIEKVVIEDCSYDHEEFEPTFINFFFRKKWCRRTCDIRNDLLEGRQVCGEGDT